MRAAAAGRHRVLDVAQIPHPIPMLSRCSRSSEGRREPGTGVCSHAERYRRTGPLDGDAIVMALGSALAAGCRSRTNGHRGVGLVRWLDIRSSPLHAAIGKPHGMVRSLFLKPSAEGTLPNLVNGHGMSESSAQNRR